jgi:hypothetical protein
VTVTPFAKDEELYASDADWPGAFVELEPTQVVRGQECALLWLYPYQHNPVRKTLAVYPDLTVTLHFHGEPSLAPLDLRDDPFDLILERLALNGATVFEAVEEAAASAVPPDERVPPQFGPYGWDYIILTDAKFETAANKLAAWKKKAGFTPLVQKIPSTWKAVDIQKALQGAYKSWQVKPKYVLLLGDAEFIPAHYKTWHPSNAKNQWKCDCAKCTKEPPFRESYIATDLYHTTMDGPNDIYPDLYLGRLSVDTLSQALDRVDDIIQYESSPVQDGEFYDRAAICTEFEDHNMNVSSNLVPTCNPDGYEEYRRAQSAEDLATFLADAKYKIQKKVDRIYTADPKVNPQKWSTVADNFSGPAGNPGGSIPKFLWRTSGFKWSGTGVDILNALNPTQMGSGAIGKDNKGRFLVLYRGHGGMDLWRAPQLQGTKVRNDLQNGARQPVVWSLACNTGWFDNETDFKAMPSWLTGEPLVDYTSSGAVSFAEEWERNAKGGAIGVIAGTRITFAILNDHFLDGMIQAIWPTYKLDPKVMLVPNAILRMGEVLQYGRDYLLAKVKSAKAQANCEAYQWFGDPAMAIRTVKPPLMMAEIPKTWMAMHPTEMVVRVFFTKEDGDRHPLGDATVTISKADETGDYWVARTDGEGNAVFPDLVTGALGEYDVVVTAPNHVPFQGAFESLPGPAGGIAFESRVYSCSSEVRIKVADEHLLAVEGLEVVAYTSGGDEEVVALRDSGRGRGLLVGAMRTEFGSAVAGDGRLQVQDGETILAEYHDRDDGTDRPAWVQDTAIVDCQPPDFPGLSSAVWDSGRVLLEWEAASAERGIASYTVYRDQAAGGSTGRPIASTWALSYPDYEVQPGQTYCYVVRAQDAVGNEDSNEVAHCVQVPRDST